MSTATLPKVKVVYCHPPIPDRSSDYAAYDDDTYDVMGAASGPR